MHLNFSVFSADLSFFARPIANKRASTRLWYQLSIEVESFIATPAVRGDVDLVQFYTSFVTDWANKMNPLLNVQISISVSKQIQGIAICEIFFFDKLSLSFPSCSCSPVSCVRNPDVALLCQN
jgi:hypothetical protein